MLGSVRPDRLLEAPMAGRPGRSLTVQYLPTEVRFLNAARE